MTSAAEVCLLIKWREVAALSLQNCQSPQRRFFLQLFENNRKKTCIIQKKVVTLQQSCKTKENDSRTRLKSYILNHLSYVKNHL